MDFHISVHNRRNKKSCAKYEILLIPTAGRELELFDNRYIMFDHGEEGKGIREETLKVQSEKWKTATLRDYLLHVLHLIPQKFPEGLLCDTYSFHIWVLEAPCLTFRIFGWYPKSQVRFQNQNTDYESSCFHFPSQNLPELCHKEAADFSWENFIFDDTGTGSSWWTAEVTDERIQQTLSWSSSSAT